MKIFERFQQVKSNLNFFFNIKKTQYNTLNVKSSNSQLNKLKSAIKKGTKVTLNLLSSVIGDSNAENNFSHKLLLTNTQVAKLCKALEIVSLVNIKLSKTQLHKIGQSGRFLGAPFGFLDHY